MSALYKSGLSLHEQAVAALFDEDVPLAERLFAEAGQALTAAQAQGDTLAPELAAQLREAVASAYALAEEKRAKLGEQLAQLMRSRRAAQAYGGPHQH